ncbi:hypothetical protein [Novosphingobium pentaromativorans]|nr:hypothetical protein [Novosphingobium pentaromativorans]AIT81618.1 hypothetical protein JI59_18535 [Novosphingobium pentaromativorans US6-1]
MDQCPNGYSDPHAYCAWRNAELAAQGKGLIWIVGSAGIPMLTDDEQVSAARRAREDEIREDERRRFNWRQQHPVTEEPIS